MAAEIDPVLGIHRAIIRYFVTDLESNLLINLENTQGEGAFIPLFVA